MGEGEAVEGVIWEMKVVLVARQGRTINRIYPSVAACRHLSFLGSLPVLVLQCRSYI